MQPPGFRQRIAQHAGAFDFQPAKGAALAPVQCLLTLSEGKFFPKLTLTTGMLDNKAAGLSSRTKDITTNATLALPTGAKLSLSTANAIGSSSSNSSSTSITLTQPLLKNGGLDANTASIRVARLDEQINRLTLKATLSQTVTQVVSAYRELLRAQEQRMIAEAALQRSKDLYLVNKALISTGRMAEVEIFQTEAEVANREVALEEAENQIDASRLALLNLLALEPRTPVVAVGAKDITPARSLVMFRWAILAYPALTAG